FILKLNVCTGNKPNSVRTLPVYARFVCTGNKSNSVGHYCYTLGLFAPEINLIVWGITVICWVCLVSETPTTMCAYFQRSVNLKSMHTFFVYKFYSLSAPPDIMS